VALKDANESQLLPRYYEAGAAVEAQETFVDGQALSYQDRLIESAAAQQLMDCLDALAIRRSPTTSQAVKVNMEQRIDHCAIDGTPGNSSDRK
jgi:hypothetical protein